MAKKISQPFGSGPTYYCGYCINSIFFENRLSWLKIDEPQPASIILVHFTGFSKEKILNISKEFNLECHLILINNLKEDENKAPDYFKQLDDIKKDRVVFVMSDFKHKHKVSELNLYFFKRGIFCSNMILF